MPVITAEETIDLDLTIHASQLAAPSRRFQDVGVADGESELSWKDPGMCLASVTNICNSTSVWDCTAPWVCG